MSYFRLTAALLLLAAIAPNSRAAPPGVTRVLRTFDFEERRLGNAEDLPMNWVKVEGTGYPHYVNGKLSNDRARSGSYSFRFDLNGGGLVYRYPHGLIPVQAGAHYRVEGYVQTTVLPQSRARITGYFADLDGHVLMNTIHHSEPYAAAAEGEGWKRLGFEMSADSPKAAYLVLELELLQPAQYATSVLGDRALFAQDIHGSAWFDDVTISQIPEVTMSTERAGNIFRRNDALQIHVTISDRFTEDLAAQVLVTDAQDKVVYQRSGAIDMSAARQMGPGQKAMALTLPPLRPGWYQASLVMSSGGKFLHSESMDLIRLPDNGGGGRPDPRFGIIATSLPFEGWDELPDLLPLMAAGRVKLALWSKDGDIQQMNGDSFDRLLEHLSELGITPTACLVDIPPALSAKLQVTGWQELLKHDPSEWRPELAYLISRHSNHLDRWQLGADGSDIFVSDPSMRKVYSQVYREFSTLIHDPDLAMPWPAWYELEGELPATVALSVPPSVLPSQLPLYMQDIKGHEGHNLSLSLQLLDREKYGRLVQVRDIAQRTVYALSSGATRIDFPLPFQIRREGSHIIRQPSEMLMVIRTLTTTLGDATYQGKVPIADGVDAFLFDRNGEGILVLWANDSVEGVKMLSLSLGERAVSVDLWGNVTPLLRATGANSAGKVQLTIGPMPQFLVDIDGQQAQLRASVSFDQPLVESSFEPHTRRIRFVNSYKTLLSGTLKLKAPPGWTLNPPTFVFSLNPGEKFDHELTVAFPYNSFAGPKTVECEFTLQDGANTNFTVPTTLTLGLTDVGMQSLALRDGNDVVIQQMVSNYGESAINYTAFTIFPGQARQERLVTNLGPGSTVVKRYRFKDVKVPAGTKVRVGVKELMGVRVLNEEVPVQ
jgi:hypothetical protein